MWQNLLALAKLVWTFGEATRQHSDDIAELQEESSEFAVALRHLMYENQRLRDELQHMREEIQHLKENEAHEREKMALRLENEMLKFENRLPTPKQNKSQDKSPE